jgi:hypothetical protein
LGTRETLNLDGLFFVFLMAARKTQKQAKKRQGTTSVVPPDAPKGAWALAPACFCFFKYAVPNGYSSGAFANPAFTGLFSMYSRCR